MYPADERDVGRPKMSWIDHILIQREGNNNILQ